MSNLSLEETKKKISPKDEVSFEWRDSLPIQRLLDVISSILVEEYVMVAKQNPEVFKVCTPPPLPPAGRLSLREGI